MNIAVSACLLGIPCRFDGEARPSDKVQALAETHRLVPICPESYAKLPIPRCPNEVIATEDGRRVMNSEGVDNTAAFEAGARKALERAQSAECELAILKSKSPSCGSGLIFDGTFTGSLTPGWGIAAQLFRDSGIPVIDENRVGEELSGEAC